MQDAPFHIFISHPSDYPTDCAPHGDGLMAYELIRRLAGRGHRLAVAYQDARLEGPVPANVSLHRIVCRVPSSALQQIEYLFQVRTLFRSLHRARPFDIIHQLNPVFPGRSALLTDFGVPLVLGHLVAPWPLTTPEEVPSRLSPMDLITGIVPPLLRFADRFQQRRAAALLLSTEAVRPHLREPERSRPRSVLLPYAVDADHFTPEGPRADLPRVRAQRVLYLGSFNERKGIYPLAEAFSRLWDTRSDVELVMAGSGPETGRLRETVRDGLADGRIRLLPGVGRADVPALIRSADLVVVPSFGEPFGLVALEAFACGKAVVATRAGGLQYLIDERGGRLVPPGDVDALAATLADLLGQPEQLAEMGRFNRRLALETYAWPKILERVEDIYRRARAHAPMPVN